MAGHKINQRWVALVPQRNGSFRFTCLALTSNYVFNPDFNGRGLGDPASKHLLVVTASPQKHWASVICSDARNAYAARDYPAMALIDDMLECPARIWVEALRTAGELRLGEFKAAGEYVDCRPMFLPPLIVSDYYARGAAALKPQTRLKLVASCDDLESAVPDPLSVASVVQADARLAKRWKSVVHSAPEEIRTSMLFDPVLAVATSEEAMAIGCRAVAWFGHGYADYGGGPRAPVTMVYVLADGKVAIVPSLVDPSSRLTFWQRWLPAGLTRDAGCGGKRELARITLRDLVDGACQSSIWMCRRVNTIELSSNQEERVAQLLFTRGMDAIKRVEEHLDSEILARCDDLAHYNFLSADGSKQARMARVEAVEAIPGVMDTLAWSLRDDQLKAIDASADPFDVLASRWKVPRWAVERAHASHTMLQAGGVRTRRLDAQRSPGYLASLFSIMGEDVAFDPRQALETLDAVLNLVYDGAWTKHDHATIVQNILVRAAGLTVTERGWPAVFDQIREHRLSRDGIHPLCRYLGGVVDAFDAIGRSCLTGPEPDLRNYHYRALAALLEGLSFERLLAYANNWDAEVPLYITEDVRPIQPTSGASGASVGNFDLPRCGAHVRSLETKEMVNQDQRETGYCAGMFGGNNPNPHWVSISNADWQITAELSGPHPSQWILARSRGPRNSVVIPGSPADEALDEFLRYLAALPPQPRVRHRLSAEETFSQRAFNYYRKDLDRLLSDYGEAIWEELQPCVPCPPGSHVRQHLKATWFMANPRLLIKLQKETQAFVKTWSGQELRQSRIFAGID